MTRIAVLDDDAWALIESVLPPLKGAMGPPMTDHRPAVEGAIYRYRSGVAWRELPADFGPWQTVWKRHHKFSLDGTWGPRPGGAAEPGAGRRADRLARLG